MGPTEPATSTTAEMEQVTKAKLMEDLRTVFVDVEELLKATASQTGERITAARAKAEESLKVAKARLAEVQSVVAAQTKAAAKAADDYVRANPWQAVGISAAVGLILGMLITRR
jgi:ElaB/YqjD/DUF883 family membrane-anchored ribosome-binding protein